MLPCVARSSEREELFDGGEKFIGNCFVGCCPVSRRSFDGAATPSSPSVVCVGYLDIGLRSVGEGVKLSLTFVRWKNLVCDSRCALDKKLLPQSYSSQWKRSNGISCMPKSEGSLSCRDVSHSPTISEGAYWSGCILHRILDPVWIDVDRFRIGQNGVWFWCRVLLHEEVERFVDEKFTEVVRGLVTCPSRE